MPIKGTLALYSTLKCKFIICSFFFGENASLGAFFCIFSDFLRVDNRWRWLRRRSQHWQVVNHGELTDLLTDTDEFAAVGERKESDFRVDDKQQQGVSHKKWHQRAANDRKVSFKSIKRQSSYGRSKELRTRRQWFAFR